jgi:hypothetical protein
VSGTYTDRRRDPAPSLYELSRYWLKIDNANYDASRPRVYDANFIDNGEPACAACGWRVPVIESEDLTLRLIWKAAGHFLDCAHLQDHCFGGTEEPANLLPLCHPCHRRMPSFDDRDDALAWLSAQPATPFWWQMTTDAHPPRDRHDLRRLWLFACEKLATAGLAVAP